MILPYYCSVTPEEYEEIISADTETVEDIVMELVESGDSDNMVDIDKRSWELEEQLTSSTARDAVTGTSPLVEDPPILAASPETVKKMAEALSNSTVDEDYEEDLETLMDFYNEAAEKGHAVVIIYN